MFGLSFTQSEVDFVVPNLAADLPLSIDPFLLYKSRDPNLRHLHEQLVSIFNQGIKSFREGNRGDLDRLIDFPEVNEIGFGYSDEKIKGSGLGNVLNSLLTETLIASPALQERGLRHVEELQLVAIGVGPDRVSDIAANAIKSLLIEYTQQQSALWNIPVTHGVPVEHIFNFEDWDWEDGYFDLPLNPISGEPVILVPRRIVRLLPWINYEDYLRTDFRMFLRPEKKSRVRLPPGATRKPQPVPPKSEVIEVTRGKLDLLDSYITRKERESAEAEPSLGLDAITERTEIQLGDQFVSRLRALPTGQAAATEFQRLIYEIFNYLFEPDLTDGQLEVSTHLGTERRDIIYVNEAERSFLQYVRNTYSSLLLLLEVKNVRALELDHINQTAAYLGARLGMFGLILTRNGAEESIVRKTFSIYNDTPSMPRKTIIIVTDADIIAMIQLKQQGGDPVKHLQTLYRQFRQKVQ